MACWPGKHEFEGQQAMGQWNFKEQKAPGRLAGDDSWCWVGRSPGAPGLAAVLRPAPCLDPAWKRTWTLPRPAPGPHPAPHLVSAKAPRMDTAWPPHVDPAQTRTWTPRGPAHGPRLALHLRARGDNAPSGCNGREARKGCNGREGPNGRKTKVSGWRVSMAESR